MNENYEEQSDKLEEHAISPEHQLRLDRIAARKAKKLSGLSNKRIIRLLKQGRVKPKKGKRITVIE